MKKSIVRCLLSVLLVFSVLVSLSGCNLGGKVELTLPQTVIDLEKKIEENSVAVGTTKANLYFDNTQSMYGYICNNIESSSMFTISCRDLADVIKGYNDYTINALFPNDKNILKWESIDAYRFNGFTEKDFYTYKGIFNEKNGEYGPLQTLLDSNTTPVNFDELNVFITDLAEQELNNKRLAEKINDIVLEKENHSVALYCITSMYSGKASVPISGVTEDGKADMLTQKYEGERPFYCLIVGPTIEVVSLCDEFDETLKSSGLAEGSDFNSVRILSKRGLKYSPMTKGSFEVDVFDNLYVDYQNEYNDYEMFPESLNFANTNLNFNTKAINYDEMFKDIKKEYPGQCYWLNTDLSSLDKTTFGKASLNFILPLSNLSDGTAANMNEISYKLADAEGQFKVYGYTETEKTTTDEYGDEITETVWVWEEIPYYELFEKTDPYMNLPECNPLPKGSQLYRINGYDIANKELNDILRDEEYPVKNIGLYTVENESGVLQFKLSFNNITELEEKYKAISIAFHVDASRQIDENVPQWILDYNLPDTETANSSLAFQKTAGLEIFYRFLIGKMSSSQERKEFESHMTKTVTDVVVNVLLDQEASIDIE